MSGRYQSFRQIPKGDLRRVLRILVSIHDLAHFATFHYVGKEVMASRAEIDRSITMATTQMGVVIRRDGPRLIIDDWGILKRKEVFALLQEMVSAEAIASNAKAAPY